MVLDQNMSSEVQAGDPVPHVRASVGANVGSKHFENLIKEKTVILSEALAPSRRTPKMLAFKHAAQRHFRKLTP
jgi:hypothetical protein